jgi:hypothetical protein
VRRRTLHEEEEEKGKASRQTKLFTLAALVKDFGLYPNPESLKGHHSDLGSSGDFRESMNLHK